MSSPGQTSTDNDLVEVRYWAAIRAAAGVPAERLPAGSLAAVLAGARARHPEPRFASVLGICAVLVDEQPVGAREHAEIDVAPGAVIDLLPPFAGGAGSG
jgi:molybdopterin synthase sulfur carrier subunit